MLGASEVRREAAMRLQYMLVGVSLIAAPASAQGGGAEVQGPPYVPPEAPSPGGFRMRFAAGATADIIYDTPIYQGGAEVGLGGRFQGSDFAWYGHLRYQGGQTNHGLTVHAPAAGTTVMYTPGRFRVGAMLETFLNRLEYFTTPGGEWGIGGGGKLVIGAELLREGDTAMFLEYRGGANWATLAESRPFAIWSPGALYLGARWGD